MFYEGAFSKFSKNNCKKIFQQSSKQQTWTVNSSIVRGKNVDYDVRHPDITPVLFSLHCSRMSFKCDLCWCIRSCAVYDTLILFLYFTLNKCTSLGKIKSLIQMCFYNHLINYYHHYHQSHYNPMASVCSSPFSYQC